MTTLKLLTRRLRPVVTTLTVSHTTVKGRRYRRAYAKIPLDLAEELARGEGRTHVVLLVGRASHLHAQYWDTRDDPLWEKLDPKLRMELEILGNAESSPEEVVLIPARPEELRELGLDPEEPITLQDLMEKIREKIRRELEGKTAASPSR